MPKIVFRYKNAPLRVVNNGHTIQVNYKTGSGITVDNQDYALLQFHFHTPSEHTKNQKRYPMELHLVHQNTDGRLAVVGVFIKEGRGHAEIQKIWDVMPNEKREVKARGTSISATRLLPEQKSRYQYNGSLTTPPCSENVLWLVLDEPIELFKEQIDAFKKLFSANARPIQPSNLRFILKSE